MTLGNYLDAAKSKAWNWGVHDCCAWPANWAGIPLPAYSEAHEATALIGAAGGMLPLWDNYTVGYAEQVTEPLAGDIGVIELLDGHEWDKVGAIFTGKRWAFVPAPGGIAAVSTTALRVWRPLCRR